MSLRQKQETISAQDVLKTGSAVGAVHTDLSALSEWQLTAKLCVRECIRPAYYLVPQKSRH